MSKKLSDEELLDFLCDDINSEKCKKLKEKIGASQEQTCLLESVATVIELFRGANNSQKLPPELKSRLIKNILQKLD